MSSKLYVTFEGKLCSHNGKLYTYDEDDCCGECDFCLYGIAPPAFRVTIDGLENNPSADHPCPDCAEFDGTYIVPLKYNCYYKVDLEDHCGALRDAYLAVQIWEWQAGPPATYDVAVQFFNGIFSTWNRLEYHEVYASKPSCPTIDETLTYGDKVEDSLMGCVATAVTMSVVAL